MRDLDLTTLRLFVTVCETGNMRRAADEARDEVLHRRAGLHGHGDRRQRTERDPRA